MAKVVRKRGKKNISLKKYMHTKILQYVREKKQLEVEFIPNEIKITEQFENSFEISMFMILKR